MCTIKHNKYDLDSYHSLSRMMVDLIRWNINSKFYPDHLLFEIDPIEAKTTYEQATQRLASLSIQEIRLSSEVLGKEPIFPNELKLKSSTVVVGEKALFAARRADLNAQLAVLGQQLLQRKQQIDEIKVEIKTSTETLELLEKQIAINEP